MRTRIYILTICLLVGASLKAQLIPNFGGQRAGLSTLSFLKNDINPRSAAMSGASVALDADAFSLYTNPAAAADLRSFSTAISNRTVGAGIQQSYASFIIPRKKREAIFGVSLNMLNSGAMDVRTEFQPEGTGEKFYVTNLAAGFTYSQKLSDMFAAGITMKYIYEQIADFSNSTAAADVSFLYKTDYNDLNFAVIVQNFGGSSAISGGRLKTDFNRAANYDADNYTVPTVFSLGASMVPWREDHQSLLVSLQLNHPNDNAENYRIGLEYEYLELLYLRAGFMINVKGQNLPAFGLGLRHHLLGNPLHISYGVNPTNFLGLQHTVGLAFTLNNGSRE